MATHRLPLLGSSLNLDGSGNVWPEPYDIAATNDVWKVTVLRFKDTSTRILIYGSFEVPQNYVTSPVVVPAWTATATSGNVVWNFDYRTVGGDDTTSLDQAGTEQQLTLTDAAPTAAHRRLEPTSMTATAGNFTVGETVTFLFGRDGSSGSDTMAADALLFALFFQYSDV